MGVPSNRRLQRRRRLPDPPTVEAQFCEGPPALAGVRNEHTQGLGLSFYGLDAVRAWDHRDCCLGGTIHVRLVAPSVDPRRLPVRLIHITRSTATHLPCTVGVSLERERLGPADVEGLLDLWTRLQNC